MTLHRLRGKSFQAMPGTTALSPLILHTLFHPLNNVIHPAGFLSTFGTVKVSVFK
jgi:hypothetical protein